MASTTQDFFGLAVCSILGDGLNIPKSFWIPGTLSGHIGHFGPGSVSSFGQSSLAAGQGVYPFAFKSDGNSLFTGMNTTTGVHTVIGTSIHIGKILKVATEKTMITSAITGVTSKTIWITGKKNSITGLDVIVAGPKVTISAATLLLNGEDYKVKSKFWDSKKSFDIPHPSKENHRLRYICMEGPSADVFIRGRSRKNTIELPYYWKNLIDEDSITVNLTPIGNSALPRVMKIENNAVTIFSKEDGILDYFYTIFAERKDTSKNIPEYKGLTPEDYPGDNREYIVNSD